MQIHTVGVSRLRLSSLTEHYVNKNTNVSYGEREAVSKG
jgi:hypothetical protein